MLIAYNNDVEYKNRWYHIQTEDNGIKDGHITTTVFHSGAILDAKTTSYKEAIAGIDDTNKQNEIIKDMMKKQHQVFYAKLFEGNYDDIVNGSAKRTSASSQVVRKTAASAQIHVSSANSQVPAASSYPSSPSSVPNASNAQVRSVPATSQISASPSRSDINNMPANAKVLNKPSILRASQQVTGVSKNLGMKSLTHLTQKPSTMQQAVAPSTLSQIAHQSGSNPQVMRQNISSPARTPMMNVSIPCSKAVENAKSRSSRKTYTGFTWPNEDLALDVLVATLLDNP